MNAPDKDSEFDSWTPGDYLGGTSQYVVYDVDQCCTCWEYFEDTGKGGHAQRQAQEHRHRFALFSTDGELIQECCAGCMPWRMRREIEDNQS